MRLKFAWPLLTTHAHQRPGWAKGKGNRIQGDGRPQQSWSSDLADIIVAVSRPRRLIKWYQLPSPVLPHSTLGLHHWQVARLLTDVAVTQATSYFVQSLQTANVIYSEVLSCW